MQCDRSGQSISGYYRCMQALEVIKFILKPEKYLHGTLISFDALNNQWRNNKINKDLICDKH